MRVLFSLLWCVSAVAFARAAEPVKITEEKGKLRIEIDGQHFADYVYEGYSRPILYPLRGPGGEQMTRNWPMKEVPNEAQDHVHHKSFWWGHGDMNGVDFWAETTKNAGKVVHEKFNEVKSGSVGVIKSRNKYLSKEGEVICTDERTMRFFPDHDGGRMFEIQVTVHASNGELKFGDTKEGTMAVRVAETLPSKSKFGKGQIVNSEGVKGDDTWGKRAEWVDYYGPVDGKTVGIAMFDHPSNPRHPTWWHVRNYGLLAANPFGLHYFENKEKNAGDMVVPAGKSVTFRYGLYLHRGDEKAGKVAEAYAEYIK